VAAEHAAQQSQQAAALALDHGLLRPAFAVVLLLGGLGAVPGQLGLGSTVLGQLDLGGAVPGQVKLGSAVLGVKELAGGVLEALEEVGGVEGQGLVEAPAVVVVVRGLAAPGGVELGLQQQQAQRMNSEGCSLFGGAYGCLPAFSACHMQPAEKHTAGGSQRQCVPHLGSVNLGGVHDLLDGLCKLALGLSGLGGIGLDSVQLDGISHLAPGLGSLGGVELGLQRTGMLT
jgi:hypothetical protein